jgi:Zn-dependent peptidase ImmA (M78 family)
MELLNQFPILNFMPDERYGYFYWRPQELTIYYSPERLETEFGKFLLLHEVGHALLHFERPADENYYQFERDAWDVARVLADKLGIKRQERFVAKVLRELRELGY